MACQQQALVMPAPVNSAVPWNFIGASASVTPAKDPIAVLPAGVASGHLLVIVATSSSGQTLSTPAGWLAFIGPNFGAEKLSAWYKIAGGSETNVTVTSTGSLATQEAVMLAYSGIKAGGPFERSSSTGGVGTAATTPSITTTATDDLLLHIYVCHFAGSAVTWTAPGGTSARYTLAALAGANNGFLIVDENKVAAGATSGRGATLSASVSWNCGVAAFQHS